MLVCGRGLQERRSVPHCSGKDFFQVKVIRNNDGGWRLQQPTGWLTAQVKWLVADADAWQCSTFTRFHVASNVVSSQLCALSSSSSSSSSSFNEKVVKTQLIQSTEITNKQKKGSNQRVNMCLCVTIWWWKLCLLLRSPYLWQVRGGNSSCNAVYTWCWFAWIHAKRASSTRISI